jgi:hypothetical protein
MSDFFEKLKNELKDGFEDLKADTEKGVDDIKRDFHNLDGEAENPEFGVPATPYMKLEEAEAAGIVEGMLKGDILTSPCDSQILTEARTPGHIGLSMTNALGVIITLPEEYDSQVKFLVKEGEKVVRGQDLISFTPAALKACAIDLVSPLVETGLEDEPERVIRVFGPIKPEEDQ